MPPIPTHHVEHAGTRAVPVASLTPFPGNARNGDVEAIRGSVRSTGQYRSLVVWENDGALIVLAGNHTLLALAAEGYTEARCEVIRCSETTAAKINLADNRLGDLGGYDNDALGSLLARLDGDYEGTGYSEGDVEAILAGLAPEDAAADGPGGAGDGNPRPRPAEEGDPVWGVIVYCDDEEAQAALLTRLTGEGFHVRAMMG
jgi:hypothetical protein